MKEIQKIPATNEIFSVLLAKKCAGDEALLAAIKSNPVKALDMRDTTLRVRAVQNTRDVLHVCVPDYEAMRELEGSELEQLSGGVSRDGTTGGAFGWLPPLATQGPESLAGNIDGLDRISAVGAG